MIKVIYNKVCGRCVQSEPLTSGMVGQPIEFEYSSNFDGLTLTAVFTNGKTTVDVLNPGNQCVIPHEVLDTVGTLVKVGIYATKGNELVIPTIYATIGAVLKGADPSGDVSADPTLPVWAQIEALMGNLNDLDTEAKNNLVAAINEAAQSGGGGGSTSIAMRVYGGYIQYSTDNGKTWVNLIAESDLKGDKGDKGDKGADGKDGVPGKDGTDGKDGTNGITPHIGENGNWYIGNTDTGKPSRGEQGVKGDKGDKGADGAPGAKGDKGDAFTYSDFTAEQLAALKGEKGNPGSPGKDGTSITISGINESAADGGTNTVTFSDGSALKVKNGLKGSAGTPGKDGADGHTPVKGTDYWTASDKAEVVAEAAAAVDLTPYAKKTEVPTKTSQLTNDSGFLTSHQDISGKQDKATLEADVSAAGFTKNTGTYSKPTGGIPKADLANDVQASLGKADTALQEHQSLAAYRTAAAQDVIDSGKVDKVTGKGLSTNDYTAAAKAKVDAIPANPKYTDTVYDDTALKERVATIEGKEASWDAKSDFSGSYNDLTDKPTIPTEVTPLIGTTGMLTPTQVYDAVSAGIPVKVQYTDRTYGLLSFTAFNVAESLAIIVSQTIVYANGGYILAELIGNESNNIWSTMFTVLAEKADIPTALPNPNAIIFTGAVTGDYDGSAEMTVNIPSAVTDDHINSLIDTKLGVIENGSY